MAEALPVWSTTRAIIDYCWRERAFVLKYAAIPVAALIAVDLGGIAAGIDIVRNLPWQIFTSTLSLLVYTPFIVTWYRRVVAGDRPPEPRPLFTFAAVERRVVSLNVFVGVILAVAIVLLATVVAVIGYGVFTAVPTHNAGVITVAILGMAAAFFWLVLFTRLSLVIAYAAAGETLTLGQAWTLTRPVGVSMTWIHIVLALIAFVPVALVGAALTFGTAGNAMLTGIVTSLVGTIGGVLYLTVFTTLYGVVYRKLQDRERL